MVGFDGGNEQSRTLDGQLVQAINADLTSSVDLTRARRLRENANLAFMGDTKGGAFDVSESVARKMLVSSQNPNGRPNSDVLRRWVNGIDITQRPRSMWIIDFGVEMPESKAALYEEPFEYILERVKPARTKSRTTRPEWWLHERPRPEMREALIKLPRYAATPRVTKHRLFVWLAYSVLADSQVIVFARDDDYFLGVLQSNIHERWARGTGSQLRDAASGFRYTPTTTFETFPFPWPPGQEPRDDPRMQAIAQAARELVEKRDAWLNPPSATEEELKRRTLTNLYNQRPTWLDLAHRKLDKAVLDAYDWPHDLSDEEILERLLALNLERAGASSQEAKP